MGDRTERDEMLQIDLCNGQVRVLLCETTQTVQKCADIHECTPVCTAALGRLMTGTLMLGIMMKGEDESVTVTIKGDGPIGNLVAVADHGNVRACADHPQLDIPPRADGKLEGVEQSLREDGGHGSLPKGEGSCRNLQKLALHRGASQGALVVRNLPASAGDARNTGQSLDQEAPGSRTR